jgi:hypothetical protein
MSVEQLVAEHGPDMRLPDLRERIASGCPRLNATELYDRSATRAKRL